MMARKDGRYGALDKRVSHQAFNLVGRVRLPDALPNVDFY